MNMKDELYRGYLVAQKQEAYDAISDPDQPTDKILEIAKRYFTLEKMIYRMDNPVVRVPKAA